MPSWNKWDNIVREVNRPFRRAFAMPNLIVVLAKYSEVQAFAQKYHDEVFHEPTAIGADRLFAGLDPEKCQILNGDQSPRRYGFYLKLGDETIGWHLAQQQGGIVFSMEGSGIRPAYQGRGYYKRLLDAVVKLAREEGYAALVSTHAANNNRIIVPKLRYGFFIKGFEINPRYGLDVKLIYYCNEAQKQAHDIRVGSRASFDDA